MKKVFFVLLLSALCGRAVHAEDGYRLWLRYVPVQDSVLARQYRNAIRGFYISTQNATLSAAARELQEGLSGLLQKNFSPQKNWGDHFIIAGTPADKSIASLLPDLSSLGDEGFAINTLTKEGKQFIVIGANTDVGVLYGCFHFLRRLQTAQDIRSLSLSSSPSIHLRLLDHWDNLNRTVERGYAGISIWNWHTLPGYIDQRYIDYARANASIGINGTVLTNVNANALVLTKDYLVKVAALARVLQPYGIKVYLTARFSAPIEIGGLKTADPLEGSVRQWWKDKAKEIHQYVPNFGGFLVKANSEGQPGPQNYGRTHSDGANMLAEAVAPYGGIVMWRAFVYSNEAPEDRFKQAYSEFQPLDGKFLPNVLIQVKNGPIDFQPREPFHPLFGAMPRTPLMMEFQLTQEYLGQGTHLVYEAPLFRECLDATTYRGRKGNTVADIIDGNADAHALTGMAGVSNIGNERNWTNHPFGQANWYAFGRLAWDHNLGSDTIADEWIRQTFSNNSIVVARTKEIMMGSREAMVNYMTPLGLHHIMGYGHHYGPAPWYDRAPRADWNPVYFHRADSLGLGFDRTATGSNALAQYATPVQQLYGNRATCPDEYVLWFHHVGWNEKLHSGKTLWRDLVDHYYEGVESVRAMERKWKSLEGLVDEERYRQVAMLLAIQEEEAVWWRNACVLYFQTFAHQPIPAGYEQPDHSLDYYKALRFPYAPGNG